MSIRHADEPDREKLTEWEQVMKKITLIKHDKFGRIVYAKTYTVSQFIYDRVLVMSVDEARKLLEVK